MSDDPNNPDPFDPAALRIDPAGADEVSIRRVLAHIRIGRPGPQEFFRLHGAPAYRLNMGILELKEEQEYYAVRPDLAHELASEIKLVEMRLGITRAGTVFLWPLPLPSADGRINAWHASARAAAEKAELSWTRMKSNRSAGCYEVFQAPSGLSEPTWPAESFADLLRMAFGNGRLIDNLDHPILKRLRGE